jgi:GTP-binding protein
MKIKTADFVMGNTDFQKCPKPTIPEYALIGRSNVGKSSLINAITGKKGLAKTSANPGKTQEINHFLINESWYLVDLPGYGYAKVSKAQREIFAEFIKEYLLNRQNLMCLFVLIDIRLEPQKNDLIFIEWLGENQVPFVLIFTKADKLKPKQALDSVERFKKVLLEKWEELPPYFITSAEKCEGLSPILDFIETTNKSFK